MNWPSFFTKDLIWIVLGLITFVSFFYLFYKSRDARSKIEMSDLVTIDGKLNDRKFQRLGAWIVSTWGFVYLITIDKLSEWYFIGYMGAWVANALIGKMIKDPNHEDPPYPKRGTTHQNHDYDGEHERRL